MHNTPPSPSNNNNSLPTPIIRHLNPATDDLSHAASLIFQVDPYICPDFFGDEKTARKMAPILFNQPGSLFDPTHTLVAVANDRLLGILIYADNTIKPWNCEKIKSDFLALGLALPDNFDRANKDYMATVSNDAAALKDGVLEIEFLATDITARNQGIGSKLLQAALALPYSEQHLTVLADNPPALHLYERLGFKIVSSQTGYPDSSVKTHNMVRFS